MTQLGTDRMGFLALSSLTLFAQLITGFVSHASHPPGRKLPFHAPCAVERTEIVFPNIISKHVPTSVTSSTNSSPWTTESQMPPTFQVRLTWRRRHIIVTLFQSDVTAKNMAVVYEDTRHNNTVMENAGGVQKDCYYQGFIKKEKSSYAALSMCDGLAGYLQTDEELLFIEPASGQREGGHVWGQRPHVMYTCIEKDSSITANGNSSDTGEAVPRPGRRKRSAGRKRYLEVQLVVDHTIIAMHGKERVTHYVMTLMNIANSVYQHQSLGVNIRVVVTELILLNKEDQDDVLVKEDPYRTMEKFCQWSTNRQSPAHGIRHNIAVLLTRESLGGPGGAAILKGLCHPSRACAAITDIGFTSGFHIAHEMAHVVGLFHDGQGNRCTGTTAMMAPMAESKLNHFWWSDCSREQMQHVINHLNCLNDDPNYAEGVKHYDLDSGPEIADDLGRPWSLDFQCRLEFGDRFGLCTAFPIDLCSMLWCSDLTTPHLCTTKRGPPMSGSSCGRDMECRGQRCVYVGNESLVNGGWGQWTDWGECSVDCGVGIKRRRRQCNNPKPAYGGRECAGESEDWDTCFPKNCENYFDARAGHCAVWNDMRIRDGDHDWQPYQTDNVTELCKQTCVSKLTDEVFTLDVDVSDGTPCDYDHPSNICYLGQCLEVGCDGVRNSTQEFDSCGVCGGDHSTCKTVSGHFTKAPVNGKLYESIVYLPKGARNIEVVKRGKAAHFIALKEADYGRYPLNGDKKRETSREFILAGARFVYSSKIAFQSLRSHGPIYANLEVMLYPDEDLSPASVTYEYSVSKDDHTLEERKYAWRYKELSQCSVTCGEGVTSLVYECYDKDSSKVVEDASCQFAKSPRADEAPCNRQSCSTFKYIWAMTNNWGECNATTCGQSGVQLQGYKCQIYHMDNDTYEDTDTDLCQADPAPEELRNCSAPPCDVKWTIGEWSACSTTCGKGQQTRTVYCGDPDTDADDVWCKDVPPRLSQSCQLEACQDVPGGDQCRDKYHFCAIANSLDLKCRSKRFASICCSSCQDKLFAAARSPPLSHWALYRQRMLLQQSER